MPIANIPFLLIQMYDTLPPGHSYRLYMGKRLPNKVGLAVYSLHFEALKGMLDATLFINQ